MNVLAPIDAGGEIGPITGANVELADPNLPC
jgi:hypothetical protein